MTMNIDTLILSKGKHTTPEQGMCLIEAAAFVAGEPFTDHPDCVSTLLADTGRRINDLLPTAQRQTLKPLIQHLIGTANDGLDQQRSALAWAWIVNVETPTWLRLAGLNDQAAALETADPNDALLLLDVARDAARDVARDVARAAARDVAWDVAGEATRVATRVAARDAARDAAWAAAWVAARAAAGSAAWVAARVALQPTANSLRASFTDVYRAMVMLGKDKS